MATYPPNQTTPVKGSGNYLWNWLGTPLKKFAEALQPYIGGSSDKLVADTTELTLNSSGNLSLNTGNLAISSPGNTNINTLGDATIFALDEVRLDATNAFRVDTKEVVIRAYNLINISDIVKPFDSMTGGTLVSINAGQGADGTANSAPGGNVQIFAGAGGGVVGGPGFPGLGGSVIIQAGYTHRLGSAGGEVYIRGGTGVSNIEGLIYIGDNLAWRFNPNTGAVQCPIVSLGTLGSATPAGKRAMIDDSTVAASGNFGAIAAGGGSNTVPVFSNGTNWLIG